MSLDLNRRRFLGQSVAIGASMGGLALGFPIGARSQASGDELNAWVLVRPDDTVVIRIARSEMGQGSLTGLAQLVAEELECDWASVQVEFPTPGQNLARKRAWGDFHTGGSRAIRQSHDYVRRGGAAARMMLVQAAAQQWQVAADQCQARMGKVVHLPTGRSLSYGQLTAAAARLPAPASVELKDPARWNLAGKSLARLDTADKTNGRQIYGVDLSLPGMLNAAIRHCPVPGGTLRRFDAAAIAGRPGVKKVLAVGQEAVAVVADTFWQAKTALEALPVEWDTGSLSAVQQADIEAALQQGLRAEKAVVCSANGDAPGTLGKATRKIESVYGFPYQNHAAMEPINATARWTPERCEVWTPTQSGEIALAVAARAAGLPPQKCEIYKLSPGGGFGRRSMVQDWIPEVVQIAKALPGTPVKLIWSREEDMIHGRYHPATRCRLSAAIDDQGNVQALHIRLSAQSIVAGVLPQMMKGELDPIIDQGLAKDDGEAMIGYSFPNLLVDHAMVKSHLPLGFWRGVNLNQNAFFLECFIDEIAHETKQDPLELRRRLMARYPKHRAVLDAVAAKAGWGTPAPMIDGRKVYRGLSQTHGYGSYVAACAEVSVEGNDVRIHRIVAATDCGYAVNPQQIQAQVEGSFVYGLSAALMSRCTVKDGAVEQRNFDSYRVLRLAQMPKVETIVMPSGGFWGGVGEPTIAVAAPAVFNAIFAATGVRVRDLPLDGVRLATS
jgi:isoquinoline 1-oxidoreductase beta subunit